MCVYAYVHVDVYTCICKLDSERKLVGEQNIQVNNDG